MKSKISFDFICTFQLRNKDALTSKLEQELRVMKKIHDDRLEEHAQSNSLNTEQLHGEIRALKRICDEKDDQVRFDFHFSNI